MTGPKVVRIRIPKFSRIGVSGPEWKNDPALPLWKQPPTADSYRHDFAHRVVRRLADNGARLAVIEDHGRPAMVDCRERLYELLSKDHAIVGVYASGARVKDIMDDLKAAGL